MKKLLFAAALTTALAGPAFTAEAKDLVYGAILKTPANPHWNAMTQGSRKPRKRPASKPSCPP